MLTDSGYESSAELQCAICNKSEVRNNVNLALDGTIIARISAHSIFLHSMSQIDTPHTHTTKKHTTYPHHIKNTHHTHTQHTHTHACFASCLHQIFFRHSYTVKVTVLKPYHSIRATWGRGRGGGEWKGEKGNGRRRGHLLVLFSITLHGEHDV